MATEIIINAATNEIIEKELTAEEIKTNQLSPQEIQSRQRQEAESRRRGAYVDEADPLFFGWQRSENTEQAWLDKVAEIRARYPYPE